ncbi:MAG: tyrosine-type recombinase/integrase [Clostridiales Family XIII bacterium]|jgi:site-specific recombinase XerD|nr:tyrosine-type recombinase/integrase [Clostridiales Family XIII bacterium]
MKHITINNLIDLALAQMESKGMAKSTIRNYKYHTFSNINKYCKNKNFHLYSSSVYSSYISHIDRQLELQNFNRNKWRICKRSINLLNELYEKGTMQLLRCFEWEKSFNPLKRQPNQDELKDPNNILTLTRKTEHELSKLGLKKQTFNEYRLMGFEIILNRHIEVNLTHHSPELVSEIVKESYSNFKAGLLTNKRYRIIVKTAKMMEDIKQNKKLSLEKLNYSAKKLIPCYYEEIIEKFENYILFSCKNKKSTITNVIDNVKKFVFELMESGINTFEELSPENVNLCLVNRLNHTPRSQNNQLYAIRKFLNYLYISKITKINYSAFLPKLVSPRTQIISGFSDQMIEDILDSVDRSTSIGKRNFAILQLATQTGLRACDISNLKRDNINWHLNEITIIQQKTDKPLCIPLSVIAGNAIADYLINGRPNNQLPYIFLSETPIRKISSSCPTKILTKYIKKLDLSKYNSKKNGFHNFRRSFAKRLLESETSIDLLKDLLGHSSIDSVKPYLSIDEKGLKRCALSLIYKMK